MKLIPNFIDNLDGNTLAQALNFALGINGNRKSTEEPKQIEEIRIATAFFSPSGFAHIAEQLIQVKDVSLLLGTDIVANVFEDRKKLDETSTIFEKRRVASGLERMEERLRQERDFLPFTYANRGSLRKLITVLRTGNMRVRRYEKAFLHAKAYIFTQNDSSRKKFGGIIAGSSNLTSAGLTKNLELNLGKFDPTTVERAVQWFDNLWNEAEDYDLAEIFEEVFEPRTPWEIFMRVLWQLYGDEVKEEAKEDNNLPLTNFQKHGVARVLRLIRDTGGAIVADEVGLGKTFIAGEILKIYNERRQRVLLICPAALRDSSWKTFITNHQLFVECLSFEQLANDIQLYDPQLGTADGKKHLGRELDEYQLIIVDEAHNYRNPNAPNRAGILRRLLAGQKRHLLFLTATPVNNSLWDLYNLLRFFLRQDAHLAKRGILSIRKRFEDAMHEDPSSLSPDLLYPIIDATTVKRTRQFVKKHYADDRIIDSEGHEHQIVFPKPEAISIYYALEDYLPGFFDKLENALDPEGSETLTFARYMPDIYLLQDAEDEEKVHLNTIIGLLRCGLLKRFESSVFAFRKTVERMIVAHDIFLKALKTGRVVTTKFIQEISGDDEAVFEDLLATTEHSNNAKLYDINQLRKAVERDRKILQGLTCAIEEITPSRDPKLKALVNELIKILCQAEDESTSSEDAVQKRKVLIFSSFEETVEWIWEFLKEETGRLKELQPYEYRMQAVSGSDNIGEVSRNQAVRGFAPVSMEATDQNDLYDLLICTDVLAEGVNLQQCRHIINFDMPWNPMRLVQRHGRIDRIRSPHRRVFLRTIFPVDRLDRLLNLNQRILTKLAMAAASVGVSAPIAGAAQGTQVFSETREEIEKLLREDPSIYERGGTASAAQTGEEYRQTLRKALEKNRNRIVKMPWKAGSGMLKGSERGVLFCVVIGVDTSLERTYLRFVPADEDWQPETAENMIKGEIGTCLRLIECEEDTPSWISDALQERVYDFWEIASKSILADWMKETDPANLQPRIRPLNHRVAKFIRANMPPGDSQDRVNRALDILESPWPRREEIMLRDWFNPDERKGIELARFLIENILKTGLEPLEIPLPLPVINSEDIELICWIGIEPEQDDSSRPT